MRKVSDDLKGPGPSSVLRLANPGHPSLPPSEETWKGVPGKPKKEATRLIIHTKLEKYVILARVVDDRAVLPFVPITMP